MRLVYLEWSDATSPNGGPWFSEEELKSWAKTDDYFVKTVGFEIESNRKYILLASGVANTTGDGETIVNFINTLKIPIPWIRRKKYLKV